MNSLGVDAHDVELLFHMLADDDGYIKSDEFIAGLQRIKGPAQPFDMVTLLGICRRLEAKANTTGKSRCVSRARTKSVIWSEAHSRVTHALESPRSFLK